MLAYKLTDTYSPAAIDTAPATNTASAAIKIPLRDVALAATPTIRLAVYTIPSLAPNSAAPSYPVRCERWPSA